MPNSLISLYLAKTTRKKICNLFEVTLSRDYFSSLKQAKDNKRSELATGASIIASGYSGTTNLVLGSTWK
jgi:hypothetical protein